MSSETLDFLCFGAHADDVEIGMSGTILKHVEHGAKIGICDLTLADLSSNGTVEQRLVEAQEAARRLGVVERVNLGFPDRGLLNNKDAIASIVRIIRQFRPKLVFVPYEDDRHPDHGAVSRLVEEAIFNAGIHKYQLEQESVQAHHVQQTFYYFINGLAKPQFLVDITPYMGRKKEVLLAYASQFSVGEGQTKTRLNTGFIEVIEGRDRFLGKMKNIAFAEGFMVKEPILVSKLILD